MISVSRLLTAAPHAVGESNRTTEVGFSMRQTGDLTNHAAIRPPTSRLIRYSFKMDDKELNNRIVIKADIFGGKPLVRGRRLTVEYVLGMLGLGNSFEDLLEGYE
jgi:Protein of unknown function (DUF433)